LDLILLILGIIIDLMPQEHLIETMFQIWKSTHIMLENVEQISMVFLLQKVLKIIEGFKVCLIV